VHGAERGKKQRGGAVTDTHILIRERVDELRQDLVHDDSFGESLRVVGEAPQRERRGLLNRGHRVEQERAQQRHHTRILQGLDVLRAACKLGNSLHERGARLLVVLKHLQNGA
jgi:hypothetical protein